ncbi:MAG: DUF2878 domain-containing protein [Rhodanobacteraceae bacterium]
MMFWAILAAYEIVWFCAVIGAGHGLAWPGVLAMCVFAAWRLIVSAQRGVELRLIVVALLLGALMETFWVRAGLIHYAATWPLSDAPAWILALWIAFALTIVPLFGYLRARPWLGALFGAIGAPLSYLAAARGWHAAVLTAPIWHALAWLALGWGIALPLLTTLARHWLRKGTDISLSPQRSVP